MSTHLKINIHRSSDSKYNDHEDEIDIEQEIRSFQHSIRPAIQQAIQLSYTSQLRHTKSSSPSDDNDNISFIKILNALLDNNTISRDICYLIERAILNTSGINFKCNIIDFNRFNNENDMEILDNDKQLTLQKCYEFVTCTNKTNLDEDTMAMITNIIDDEIEIYKQCIEELQGEIEIIKSIFNAEHDGIMIHMRHFQL